MSQTKQLYIHFINCETEPVATFGLINEAHFLSPENHFALSVMRKIQSESSKQSILAIRTDKLLCTK